MTSSLPSVRISEPAQKHVRELARWWRQHRRAARTSVPKAFKRKLKMLREEPGLGALFEEVELANVRRTRLHPIMPYMVYYTFDEAENEILVHAVWSSMRPDPTL